MINTTHILGALVALTLPINASALATLHAPNVMPVNETFSFNDGSTRCAYVVLSPYADKATIAAALRDASALVAMAGCVNVTFDADQDAGSHMAGYEGGEK